MSDRGHLEWGGSLTVSVKWDRSMLPDGRGVGPIAVHPKGPRLADGAHSGPAHSAVETCNVGTLAPMSRSTFKG